MVDRSVRFLGLAGIVSLSVACANGASVDAKTGNAKPLDDDGENHGDGDDNGSPGQGDGDGDSTTGDGDGTPGGGGNGGDGDGTNAPVDDDPRDGASDDAAITFPMTVDFYYATSGYAGDGATPGLVTDTQECPVRAGSGRGLCHAFTYTPGSVGWAGVFWQYPADNGGTELGRPVPAGAKSVSFYAWSDAGGEVIQFGAGLQDHDAFAIVNPAVTLKSTPTRYTISLDGVDYGDDVVSAFLWTAAAGNSERIAFYLDDIAWEGELVGGDNGGGGDNTGGDGDVGGGGGGGNPPPDFPAGPGAAGVSLRVRNLCNVPLFIGGAGQGFALSPDRKEVKPGEIANYDVPNTCVAARVNAFRNATDGEPRDKVELTLSIDGQGANHAAYNVTYVDWLGLPVEMTAVAESCAQGTPLVGCYAPVSEVLSGCPQGFLLSNDRCLSPRTYCLSGHQDEAYCRQLDQTIASCADCPKGSTTEVFACSGPYANEPRMCAALNRGTVDQPDNPDPSIRYKKPPFNDYSKWVHEVCPGIYATCGSVEAALA